MMLSNCGAGEDSWESLDSKEIQPVNPKGSPPWLFIRRIDAEAPIIWPPDAKSWLIGKDSDAGRNWGEEEKGMTEDEMDGWHHWLEGREFGWTLGVGDGQGGLVCCDSWGHKESDMTERLNWLTDFANKGLSSQSYGFSCGHVWMWELDYKGSWALRNWCFWTVVLEKTLESPWTARRSNQSILNEISSEYSLEGLMLKLKL